MLKDGQLICDVCQKPITRITEFPAEGWERMHNLCSACFDAARQRSVPRPS